MGIPPGRRVIRLMSVPMAEGRCRLAHLQCRKSCVDGRSEGMDEPFATSRLTASRRSIRSSIRRSGIRGTTDIIHPRRQRAAGQAPARPAACRPCLPRSSSDPSWPAAHPADGSNSDRGDRRRTDHRISAACFARLNTDPKGKPMKCSSGSRSRPRAGTPLQASRRCLARTGACSTASRPTSSSSRTSLAWRWERGSPIRGSAAICPTFIGATTDRLGLSAWP